MTSRRGFLTRLLAVAAAPAILPVTNLMPEATLPALDSAAVIEIQNTLLQHLRDAMGECYAASGYAAAAAALNGGKAAAPNVIYLTDRTLREYYQLPVDGFFHLPSYS